MRGIFEVTGVGFFCFFFFFPVYITRSPGVRFVPVDREHERIRVDHCRSVFFILAARSVGYEEENHAHCGRRRVVCRRFDWEPLLRFIQYFFPSQFAFAPSDTRSFRERHPPFRTLNITFQPPIVSPLLTVRSPSRRTQRTGDNNANPTITLER